MLNVALDGHINDQSTYKIDGLDNTSLWRKIIPHHNEGEWSARLHNDNLAEVEGVNFLSWAAS